MVVLCKSAKKKATLRGPSITFCFNLTHTHIYIPTRVKHCLNIMIIIIEKVTSLEKVLLLYNCIIINLIEHTQAYIIMHASELTRREVERRRERGCRVRKIERGVFLAMLLEDKLFNLLCTYSFYSDK